MRLWNEDSRTEFVVAPHHPDRLRRPLPTLVAPGHDAFRHALTWNVFRTLELISPPFWLRRFHLRCRHRDGARCLDVARAW